MKRLFLIVAFLAMAVGCEKLDDEQIAIVVDEQYRQIVVAGDGETGLKVCYTVRMPQGEEFMASTVAVVARATASWIVNIDTSKSGYITFDAEANDDVESRMALIGLSADGARTAVVMVTQEGRSGSGGGNNGGDDNNGGGNGNGGNAGNSDNVWRTGWAELPCEFDADKDGCDDKDNTLYYAHHMCAGGEKNAQNNGTARNYTVCYSGKYHCPVWVAAPRHKMYEGSSGRTEDYQRDPDIPSGLQYSSKSTGGGCNKGHMLGSAERTSSTATNRQVFYYTNIAPQYSANFNTGGGGWNVLEDWVDTKVCSDTTYVVIGTYFEAYTDKHGYSASPKKIEFGGRSDVSCPTMYYYILLRTKKGNTGKSVLNCSADELMCAAFVRAHSTQWTTSTSKNKVSSADLMSVSDLEKLTGFVYFPNVPNAPKSTFNASDWGL